MHGANSTYPSGVEAPEGTDLRAYFEPIRRRWILIVALVAVATVGTYQYYSGKPKTFQTSTDLLIGNQDPDLVGGAPAAGGERTLANLSRLLRTEPVAAAAAKQLRFRGDPRALLGSVSASPQGDSDIITVSAVGSSGESAAMIANGFAEGFIAARRRERKRQAQEQLVVAQERLDNLGTNPANGEERASLRDQIDRLNTTIESPQIDMRRLDTAPIPAVPTAPKPKQNAIFAFALSLLLGVLAAFGLDRLDRRIKTVDNAEGAFRLPLIGVIPHARKISPVVSGAAAIPDTHKEVFRTLRMSIGLAAGSRPLRTLVVASGMPGEGKSSIVRNLALVYKEAGLRVAVIEADLRRPSLAELFNVPRDAGLTEYLSGKADIEGVLEPIGSEATAAQQTALAGAKVGGGTNGNGNGNGNGRLSHGELAVITSGRRPENPLDYVGTHAFHTALDRLKQTHDIVLIDTPPLLAVSDAIPLIAEADGTLVVCRLNHSTHVGARQVTDLLSRIPGADVLGVVANDVPADALVGGHYAYYGY
ncbi:MAG TPA: P-loop NTPase [Thermoleophilaceae bacterium]|nr:P-loop NTPase [Thermoleophilaceae bacterium]